MKKITVLALLACQWACRHTAENAVPAQYLKDETPGIKTGGVKLVQIESMGKKFKVWTKRFGNSPSMKLLLLSGGPGTSHEYFECMESFLPAEGIEIIYYDQLGTGFSDNPNDTAFWDLDRYVDELEQVRRALGLNKNNCYLLGHSWGGLLGMQYALKHQDSLKALIISNMMSDVPAYGRYATEVLAKGMDSAVVAEIRQIEDRGDYDKPRYMELLLPNFYEKHVMRMPAHQWPDPANRAMGRLNQSLYVTMQGPSEFGVAGKLVNWSVQNRLKELKLPTLVIGATHDTMDPEHMKMMAKLVQNGSFLLCANGSHMSLYDDQDTYMAGLIKFMIGVNQGKTKDLL
jgi:proline iminopeptidase